MSFIIQISWLKIESTFVPPALTLIRPAIAGTLDRLEDRLENRLENRVEDRVENQLKSQLENRVEDRLDNLSVCKRI